MARRYPQEVHDFIRDNVSGRTTRELVRLTNECFNLGFTENSMKSYKTNHKLRSGTPVGLPKGHPSTTFPQEVSDYIHANYKGVGNKEMAERLNGVFGTSYTTKQLNCFYKNHKLNSGITGRFEKGSTPPNKGRKGYCAPGSEKGHFKKGNLPENTKPIGYERITQDGYIEVKIAMRPSRVDCNDNFAAKHRLAWERANGPIPPGHLLIFLDGDKTNCELSNLRLITLAENIEMNRRALRSTDPELTESGILIARVRTTAFKKRRRAKKGANRT